MLQKLYQKARRGILALPLLAGLGLTSPAVAKAKDGLYVGVGGEVQLFSEGVLQEVYGRGLGGYGKVGGSYSIVDGGIKVGYISQKGDKEEIKRFFSGKEVNENLGIFYFGPYFKISPEPVFFKIGYEFCDLGNQEERITQGLFERGYITRTDRHYLEGLLFGGGFSKSFRVEDDNHKPLDFKIDIGIDFRTAEIIKGPSLQGSFQFTF